MNDQALLASAVREAEPDRYLSTLYAPEDRRAGLLALHAFDTEIASLRDKVREPMAGEIRLQWWRDALSAPPGERTGNPVADAVRDAMRRFGLPLAAFDRLLEARIFDLYDDPMPDRPTLEGYLGETRSAVVQLAMLILDADAAPRFAEAAGHAGCAAGIAELLRALPLHRRRSQCFVPADLLAAAGTSREAFLEGAAGALPALGAFIALGREHLAQARAAARDMPASLRPALLPAASAGAFLAAAERAGLRAFDQPPRVSALRRQWRMMRMASRGPQVL